MTPRGAAAAIAPEPEHGSGAVATADDDETITWADLKTWERQLARTGGCSRPVRLRGVSAIDMASGEVAGGVIQVACGNRRETACPSCSALYKGDARQLVRAGLSGGKGVPESVATHPCVFATLTAPSFGPVHARRMRGKTVLPCRPRRDANDRRCPHGRDISCPARHAETDPRLGWPLCGDCYDYEAAVLFNLHAADLWRRFTTYLPRHLARLAGVTGRRLRGELGIRFVKVAEYQARGVVHFHAVIRLDANTKDGYAPPPARYDAALLIDAIALAVKAVRLDVPGSGPRIRLRFGRELDARPIWRESFAAAGQPLDVSAVANYIAKYATKAADVPGLPDTRIRIAAAITVLRCSAHHKRMVATAWRLGAPGAVGDPRLRLWAHMLGYGGHFLTKSRRYSVTFGQLRQARTDHRRQLRPPGSDRDSWGRPLDETVVLVLPKQWTYEGIGHTVDFAQLALAAAARAREHHGQADAIR
jgi:replication initiator protein RepSA